MAKDKKSFILYSDLLDKIEVLTIEERGFLFTHLLEYVNDLNPILTDRLLITAWKPIELELKRDLKKYEEAKESKANGGRLGNLKRWNTDLYNDVYNKKISLEEAERIANDRKLSHSDSKESHTDKKVSLPIASVAVNDNVNVNDNDNVNDIKYNNTLISKEEAFELFWNNYDKKADRAKSIKQFQKIDNSILETVINKAKVYADSIKDKQFQKLPTTWLNGRNWEDEVVEKEKQVNRVKLRKIIL